MGNLKTRKTTPVSQTYPEWLGVSAAIGRMVNEWSGRHDVVAFAGPIAGQGSPACYSPHTGEVEVNSDICFGGGIDPTELERLDDSKMQYEWPRAVGAIFHEAMHARFSLWDLVQVRREVTPLEFHAMILLEEGRIEAQGLEMYPRMSGFLRTMAVDMIIDDPEMVNSASDTVMAANVAALTLARVDAGSLDANDVDAVRELLEARLGADTIEKLRGVWQRFQAHRWHMETAVLKSLAKEWTDIVKEAAEENGETPGDDEGTEGDPSSGSGAGSGDSEGSGSPSSGNSDESTGSSFADEINEALREAAEASMFGAYDDLMDAEMQDEYDEVNKARKNSASEQKNARKEADNVFGSGTSEIHGTSSRSSVVSKRSPTSEERSAAVKIGTMIDKAKYRERSETEVTDVLPPGRLRSRAAVQAAALKSRGVASQVDTWRRTVRRQTDDPTLSIGVMVDISGSMGAAMDPMASTAWIMSEAARRADARAAMVYYGNDVFSTLKPGQHLNEVRVWTAPDGTEKFDKAFKALDGGLNLLHGSGVRMLVVVSDGEYTGSETAAANKWIRRCAESGVAVIWVDNKDMGYGSPVTMSRILNGGKAAQVTLKDDPTDVATLIGDAATKALASVS